MIEELKEEKLIEKVGGRFRLTSLIQKRLAVLNRGSHPLVQDPTGKNDNMQIVVREILENKIRLDMHDNVEVVDDAPAIKPEEF
jgi:DNA-directed RNA polymerase subunit omega